MLASEFGGVSERRRLKRSSRPIRARSRARRSTSRKSVWSVQARTKMRCRLPKENCADFSEVSLQLPASSAWRLLACGGFFCDEHIIVLEARSILYAVRYGESCCPPGRLLILSDNLALVLARSDDFPLLSVMRRICVSGFRAGSVLPFRWILSESNYSDEGSRFFDRDHDPSKSLLQVLAQRLPRFSPAPTVTKTAFLESLPETCSPMPDASSGGLSEKFDEFQESREAGTKWLREFEASPLAKEEDCETSCKKTSHFLRRSPHGWFLDDDTTACACWSVI